MSLDAYRIFHVTGQTGNVTQAAARLYISQPAVSKAIRNLEDQVGFPLFKRHARGVTLTAEGQVLFRYVEEAMQQLEAGEQMASRLRQLDAGIVRIGISHTLCRHWFLPHLKVFHDRYPSLRIQVLNRTGPETARLLYAGELDFGIVSQPDENEGFLFTPLTKVEDIFVTNRREQVPDEPISLTEIVRYPLMLLEKENTSRLQLEKHFAAGGVELKAEIEISSMDFLIEFAKIGLGVAAVVRSFVSEELASGELFELPVVPPPGSREVGLLVHPETPMTHAARVCMRFLMQETNAVFNDSDL